MTLIELDGPKLGLVCKRTFLLALHQSAVVVGPLQELSGRRGVRKGEIYKPGLLNCKLY